MKYIAPESRFGSHVPYKSDMYSLGIILHLMITKHFPDFFDHIKSGVFETSEEYSEEIV